MADALASGASVRKDVGVQVPPRPLLTPSWRVWSTACLTPGVSENISASEVRYGFASDEWLTALEQTVDACIAEARAAGQLDGVAFSLCEVYESVPVQVNPGGRVAWSLVLEGGDAKFARTELDEADLKVVADYEVLEPVVRVRFDQGPPPEVAEALAAAGKQGRFRIHRGVPSPEAIASLHNRVAGITR